MAELKMLQGAKLQWAVDNKGANDDVPTFSDLVGRETICCNLLYAQKAVPTPSTRLAKCRPAARAGRGITSEKSGE